MTDGAHSHPDIERRLKLLEDAQAPVPPPIGGRPWPAAVTTRTIPIPPSIDASGATDVTALLKAFIRGVGNGSLITGGGPGATYKVSGSILMGSAPQAADSPIKGKSNIVFDGQGATINNVSGSFASTASNEHSTFYWSWLDRPYPTDLAFRNWVNKGANPQPGHLVGSEFAAFAHIMGGVHVEVDNISGGGMWGDLVTVNANAQYIWVHDCKPTDVGRNNVSVVEGSHVLVEDNAFGNAGYCTFDVEPESTQTYNVADIIYRRNTSGAWLNCFVALDGSNSGKAITDIVIDDNTSAKNLLSIIGFSGTGVKTRPQRVSFQRNHGPAGGALKFSHIDVLTVKGNDGTITILDCPGAITSPNP